MTLRSAAQITHTLQAQSLQLRLALGLRTQLGERGRILLVLDEQLDRTAKLGEFLETRFSKSF